VEPLEVLFDGKQEGRPIRLPEGLLELYGGGLSLPDDCLYANFVSSVDGVVALGDPSVSSGPALSGRSEADRFVMGLLRAVAGAVLIGGGTLRDDPGHLWTAPYIFPPLADDFAQLRSALGLDASPLLVVVTASGEIDVREKALEQGALVLTTESGAARLQGRLPTASKLRVLGETEFGIERALAAVRAEGVRRLLSEGGPRILGQLVGPDLVDDLFLTFSPVLAGRAPDVQRLGLLEGLALPAGALRTVRLSSVRRHGGHLLLRYAIKRMG
jgi:riboflavin biosynthesis pyrimidine reductase